MPMNTSPVFTLTPNNSWGTIIAADANTAYDGTGTVTTIWTAGSEGGIVNNIRIKSMTGTATSAAGVFRLWINNGSTNATATNNTLILEMLLNSVTASATANTLNFSIPINEQMQAGHKLICTVSTMAANTVWAVTALGANY